MINDINRVLTPIRASLRKIAETQKIDYDTIVPLTEQQNEQLNIARTNARNVLETQSTFYRK